MNEYAPFCTSTVGTDLGCVQFFVVVTTIGTVIVAPSTIFVTMNNSALNTQMFVCKSSPMAYTDKWTC